MQMVRVGVFATEYGWRLSGPGESAEFESRFLAVKAAYRLARLARWRGADVEVLIQARRGEALTPASISRLPTSDD